MTEEKSQQSLTVSDAEYMRDTVVERLIAATNFLRCPQKCLFSSIYFLDKYRGKTETIGMESFHLLPMALINITSSLDSFGGIDMRRMLNFFGGGSTIEQVNDMEKKIRSTIEIQVRFP